MLQKHYLKLATSFRGGRYSLSLSFSERRLLLFSGDVVCLILTLLVTNWLHDLISRQLNNSANMVTGQMNWVFFLAILWLGLAAVNELYVLQTAHQPTRVMTRLFLTTIEVGALYLLIFFVVGRPIYIAIPLFDQRIEMNALPPRTSVIIFLILLPSLVALWRLVYTHLVATFALGRRALVVGAGRTGRTLVQALREASLGYELVGFIDDDRSKHGSVLDGIPVLGGWYDLQRQIEINKVNEVVLAITGEIHTNMLQALMSCHERGIAMKPLTVLYEDILERVPVEHLGSKGLPSLFWQSSANLTTYRLVKRLTDLILGLVGVVILAPLLPFLALAIYVDSPGSVFYTQTRLGRGGRSFRVLKLRSMILHAEQGNEARWASRDDDRITRVGRILRRIRLDELPQVINVLKGEMSIVGPRPERPQFVGQLQEEIPFYRARLAVKPGLTGWAQIKYRYGNTVEDALYKLQYDLYYIKHQSLVMDMLIILRTLRVLLTFQGM